MPILAVLGTTPPVTGGGTDTGVVDPGVGAIPTAGASSLTLTTADGTVYNLSDPLRMVSTLGRRGFDAAQYTVFADESPLVDGEVFRGARALPRDLILPIYLRADTRPQFLALKRELLAKLAPTRGLASLEVAEDDGTRRRIECYFTGRGAEGEGARDRAGRNWARYNLELRCPDPFWKGDPIRLEFVPPDTTNTFLPILPLRVQSGQTFGDAQFDNPGDVMAYPIWTIHGPVAGNVILRRTTPGFTTRSIILALTLGAGDWVVVDTRPDRLAIVDDADVNRWPALADGSSLWRVTPGANSVEVVVPGTGPTTRIVLDVEPRFETA